MAGHSHRHIGDIEDMDYVDLENGFIIAHDRTYENNPSGKAKRLGGYARITIEFSIENEVSSHRYTAVYYTQSGLKTKAVTGYAFMKTVGSSMNLDLSGVPQRLYVINEGCSAWEVL
jgi:hypothetical protein